MEDVQGPAWELSKENVLPQKAGRRTEDLTNASLCGDVSTNSTSAYQVKIDMERRAWEEAIEAADTSDDPLEIYKRYVKWMSNTFPAGSEGKGEAMLRILERIMKKFCHDKRYTDDARFLRLCIAYADCCREPKDIFTFLHTNKIGKKQALFYEAWALVLENVGLTSEADKVYSEGIIEEAQPAARLKRRHEEFQHRLADKIKSTAITSSHPTSSSAIPKPAPRGVPVFNDENASSGNSQPRTTLAAIGGAASVDHPSAPSATVGVTDRPRPAPRRRPSVASNTGVPVFVDAQFGGSTVSASTEYSLPTGQWDTLPSQAAISKENNQRARPWTHHRSEQDPLAIAARERDSRRCGVVASDPVEFSVFVDEGLPKKSEEGTVFPESNMTVRRQLDAPSLLGERIVPKEQTNLGCDPLRNFVFNKTEESAVTTGHNKVSLRERTIPIIGFAGYDRSMLIHEGIEMCFEEMRWLKFSGDKSYVSRRVLDTTAPRTKAVVNPPPPLPTNGARGYDVSLLIRNDVESSFEEARAACVSVAIVTATDAVNNYTSSFTANNSERSGQDVTFTSITKQLTFDTPIATNGGIVDSAELSKRPSPRKITTSVPVAAPAPPPSPTMNSKGPSSIVPPSPTINTKAALADVMAMFTNKLPFEDDDTMSFSQVQQRDPIAEPFEAFAIYSDEVPAKGPTEMSSKPSTKPSLPATPGYVEPGVNEQDDNSYWASLEDQENRGNNTESKVCNGTANKRPILSTVVAVDSHGLLTGNEFDENNTVYEDECFTKDPVNNEFANEATSFEDRFRLQSNNNESESWNFEIFNDSKVGMEEDASLFTLNESAIGGGGGLLHLAHSTPFALGTASRISQQQRQFGNVIEESDEDENIPLPSQVRNQEHRPALSPILETSKEESSISTSLSSSSDDISEVVSSQTPLKSPCVRSSRRKSSMASPPTMRPIGLEGDNFSNDTVDKDIVSTKSPVIPGINPFDQDVVNKLSRHVTSAVLHGWSHFVQDYASTPSQLLINAADGDVDCGTLFPSGIGGSTTGIEVNRKLGDGAWASVYLGTTTRENIAKEKLAIKIQRPACPWESYMLMTLHERLGVHRDAVSFVGISGSSVHGIGEESVSALTMTFCGTVTLMDAINAYVKFNRRMDETLVMFYTVELLRMVETLHDPSVNILHGDIKVDNLMLRHDVTPGNDDITWNSTWRADGECGWASRGLALVDFGRSMDLSLVRELFCSEIETPQFIGSCNTDSMECPEMVAETPWTYQADIYGLLSVVHCMLHSQYLNVERDVKTGRWIPKLAYLRYWQIDIWATLFDDLLNFSQPDAKPDLGMHRRRLERFLENNPYKAKSIDGLLTKQNVMLQGMQ